MSNEEDGKGQSADSGQQSLLIAHLDTNTSCMGGFMNEKEFV
jgi:hypothetical protein